MFRSRNNSVPVNSSLSVKSDSRFSRCIKCHFRGPRGFGSYLILLVTCLFFSYQENGLYILLELGQSSLGKLDQWQNMAVVAIILEATPKLLFPLAGWLADAKFGRQKVLSAGLLMTWVCAVALLLVSVLNDYLNCFNDTTFQVIIAIIYIISAMGTAFFHANLVPFGIDQMKDCSSDEMSSFVHWYYLARNVNLGVILQLTLTDLPAHCNDGKYDHWISLVQVFLLTIGICLLYIFSKDFKTNPLIYNPLRVVRLITQYILKHSKPVRYRSAYTYVSEVKPMRSDFAKKSYGGIFEDDIVEEVVTFWRFLVFLIPIGISCTLFLFASYIPASIYQHLDVPSGNSCAMQYAIINIVPIITYLVCIPIYEFIICPFFRKYIPRLRVKIGIGMVVLLVAFVYLLAVDASAHVNTNITHKEVLKEYNISSYQLCFLFNQSDLYGDASHLTFSVYTLIPFIVVVTIGELLIFLTILEFICAQAPDSMRSLLISTSFFMYGISAIIMSIFILPFGYGFKSTIKHLKYSCGSAFLASVIAFGIIGLILYFFIANWYKNRQRGGQTNINYQSVIEGYYERLIEQRRRRERYK